MYYKSSEQMQVLDFNTGRTAILAALSQINLNKVYIPYYNCEVVYQTLIWHKIPVERYFLDEELQPRLEAIGEQDWLVYVNYFGIIPEEKLSAILNKYQRVIFDNTQCFYQKPILADDCFNIYSCRKFFGVSDGAYLIWNHRQIEFPEYPQDISWKRAAYLLKSVETGTNGAYRDNIQSEEEIGTEILRMSPLTKSILHAIDYEEIRQKRVRNLQILQDLIGTYNEINLPIKKEALMIYPLYIKNSRLREQFVEHHIYVPQWWNYLLDILPEHVIETDYCRWLYPLPIDQRYSEDDMIFLAYMVQNIIKRT